MTICRGSLAARLMLAVSDDDRASQSDGMALWLSRQADYEEYISSESWALKRSEYWAKFGTSCKRCGATNNLQVHHHTYARFRYEDLLDLVGLCKSCHEAVHAYHRAHPAMSLSVATMRVVGLEHIGRPAPRRTPRRGARGRPNPLADLIARCQGEPRVIEVRKGSR